MRRALESLPWARNATVDFAKKQASVTVDVEEFEPEALIAALEGAGFGGALVDEEDTPNEAVALARVTFQVSGMMKTKSGAT